jgi:ribosome recycling factor
MAAPDDSTVVLETARDEMDKSIASLRHDLQRVRTGRANPQLLEGIRVDYYGTPTPLNQMANLTTPDPRLIVIAPYDRAMITAIEKAIQTSNLGYSPNNDGKVVRIPIPPLTEERRKDLVKQLHKIAEEHKLGVREARREALQALKELESDGSLPEDDRHRADKKVQDLTDEHVKKIEEISAAKEKEILQV